MANEADGAGVLKAEGGVFAGVLPSDVVVANTATRWSGTLWTMVMWPSIGPRPAQQRRLLMHESFHRIQADLGLPAANANNPHLDSLEGRYWFLLELRALAEALRAEEAGPAIGDALAFRARRQSLFEGAEALERALENNEGLAEYTGYALRGTVEEETRLALARRLEGVDRESSSCAASPTPPGRLRLLLDAADAGWRRSLQGLVRLAATLAAAAKVSPADDPVAGRSYDDGSLRASEEESARVQAARVAGYRRVSSTDRCWRFRSRPPSTASTPTASSPSAMRERSTRRSRCPAPGGRSRTEPGCASTRGAGCCCSRRTIAHG